jgi:SAM-dependent methyltransferase
MAESAAAQLNAGPPCPICAHPRSDPFAAASDRLFGLAQGSYRLARCLSCGCIFQHPMPDVTTAASFYPPDYWWSDHRRPGLSGAFSRMEKAYREFVALDHVRFLGRWAGAGGRSLLDVGCGSGTFLHLAERRGFSPHGMDVSARAVTAARDQYRLPVRQGDVCSGVWQGHSFDVVTMFHVLEHLPDPKSAVAHACALLKPGGCLIVQVPNARSIQARLFGPRWYGFDVPRHLVNFTPQGLRHLLTEAGLECKLVRHFSLRDNPAALASSLAVRLDPIGRRGRGKRAHAAVEGGLELFYFMLVLLAFFPTLVESWCGRGATLWALARHAEPRDTRDFQASGPKTGSAACHSGVTAA